MKASTYSFDAIGTHWAINIVDTLGAERLGYLFSQIKNRIELFDKAYSRFRSDSQVMDMSRLAGTHILPIDADTLLTEYKMFYDATDGKVTPLIGDVLAAAGYDDQYTLRQSRKLQSPKKWEDVLEYQYPKLILKEKTILDFGAGGKGYLVDILSVLLDKEGVDEYCIDAGGDMLVRNQANTPLIVGLEDPEDSTKVIGTVTLSNQSLAGSAGNRRAWGDFHHIIDPEKLSSPRHILGLWVIADTTIRADLLATALFFVAPEVLLRDFDFQYLIMSTDRAVVQSVGFNATLFT
jgi:FAD:protein FMN transferase